MTSHWLINLDREKYYEPDPGFDALIRRQSKRALSIVSSHKISRGDRKSSASARDRVYESSFFISKKSQSYSFSEGSGPKSIDESR